MPCSSGIWPSGRARRRNISGIPAIRRRPVFRRSSAASYCCVRRSATIVRKWPSRFSRLSRGSAEPTTRTPPTLLWTTIILPRPALRGPVPSRVRVQLDRVPRMKRPIRSRRTMTAFMPPWMSFYTTQTSGPERRRRCAVPGFSRRRKAVRGIPRGRCSRCPSFSSLPAARLRSRTSSTNPVSPSGRKC